MLTPTSPALTHFPDPYVWRVPRTTTIVIFYGYRGSVPVTGIGSALGCIIHASNEASEHIEHWHQGTQPMGAHPRIWHNIDNSVFLKSKPSEEMTWSVLGALLFAVRVFVRDMACEFEFSLWTEGLEGEAGFGQLTVG